MRPSPILFAKFVVCETVNLDDPIRGLRTRPGNPFLFANSSSIGD